MQTTAERRTGPREVPADKFARRRDELAAAALQTLAELGYARTSLREIAQNTEFSHGVLHYYFRDKADLLSHSVKRYHAVCVHRYDRVLAEATDAEALVSAFAAAVVATADADGPLHRLWYDVRSQAAFEESLRADVLAVDATLEAMVWQVVTRYAQLRGARAAADPALAYAVFDGAFQQALLRSLAGDGQALPRLAEQVRQLLGVLVP